MTLDVIQWLNRGENKAIEDFIKGFKRGAKDAIRKSR